MVVHSWRSHCIKHAPRRTNAKSKLYYIRQNLEVHYYVVLRESTSISGCHRECDVEYYDVKHARATGVQQGWYTENKANSTNCD